MISTKNNTIISLIVLLFFQLFCVKILSVNEYFLEDSYPFIFSLITFIQKSIFQFFCFDVGNFLYGIVVIAILFSLYKAFKNKKVIQTFLLIINLFVFFFYLFWGFNYYNNKTETKYFSDNITDKQLIHLTEYLYQKTVYFSKFSTRNKVGNYVIDKQNSYENLLKAQTNTKILSTINFSLIKNIKPSLFSEWFSYLGIGGMYNPFTAEAIYNNTMPEVKLPFTIAHEMSHQIGFASEAEANFIGFLVGSNASNLSIKYAVYYAALKYSMRSLAKSTPILYYFYLNRFNNKMKLDYKQEKQYFYKYSSDAEIYFSYSNDIFLKLNNQKDGINSYQKFIFMLVNYLKI